MAKTSKILDNEFRNGLYKSLVEVGYDKVEAQKIIGVKYLEELKNFVIAELDNVKNSILEGKFEYKVNENDINSKIDEMVKIKSILG